MPPIIDQAKCTGCGICADICNSHIFTHKPGKGAPVIKFPDECWHCNSCVLDCPSGAVSLRMPLPYGLMHVKAPSHKAKEAKR